MSRPHRDPDHAPPPTDPPPTTHAAARRFLALYAATLVLMLGAIAAGAAVIDPFRVYRLALRDDLNPHKLDVGRVMKAQMIRSNNAATVVLGSSRVVRAIDPEHPAWRQRPVVNAALGGARINELADALRLAAAEPETQRVVLFLDLYMTTAPFAGLHDYNQSLLNPKLTQPARHATALVSRRAIEASIQVLQNRRDGERHDTWPINGYRDMGPPKGPAPQRQRFNAMIRDALSTPWMYGQYQWDDRALDILARALDRALDARPDLEITLALMPIHAEHHAVIDAAGLRPEFDRFKRELTRLAADRDLALWDFAVFHPVTTERAPPAGAPELMTYWWESSHASAATGDLVVQRLNDTADNLNPTPDRAAPNPNTPNPNTPTTAPPPFGVRLTPDRIERHLPDERAAYEAWAERRRGTIANVRHILNSIPPAQRPPKRRPAPNPRPTTPP